MYSYVMNNAEFLAAQMRSSEIGAVSEYSAAFSDSGEGGIEVVVPTQADRGEDSAAEGTRGHGGFDFKPPGCIVFIGSLSAKQDGNGWWSKLAMMKGYAQLGFHIAIWTRTKDGDPLGQLTRIDPLGDDPLVPTKLGAMDLHAALPHVAAVIDRYSPTYSQPEVLRLIFSDDERGCHPRIIADFADVNTWVQMKEGRQYSRGESAYYSPSIAAAWRPELLRQYDVVQLPKGPAAQDVRKVLEAA